MADFALKLRTGEKVAGKWACTVAARRDSPAPVRDRALALVTNARLFLFAERHLHLAELHKRIDGAGNVSESRTPHEVAQFEAVADDLLTVMSTEVWEADGAVNVAVAVGDGVVELWLRCLDDVETPNLLGALNDLRNSAKARR